MAKPNYAFEKRQRDLAKKQKKEEKRARKQERGTAAEAPVDPEGVTAEGVTAGDATGDASGDEPAQA